MDPATITALAAVATQAGNSLAQSSMNRKTREWNEKQYGKQRADALSDWARTNEYNSPLQQMARLKEAGLSPHLIYGGGANSISQPVRSTDTKSWSPQAPQFDGGQIVSQYFGVQQQQNALKIQEEQIRGLKIDNDIKEGTKTDTIVSKGLTNRATQAKIDNFLEDIKLKKIDQEMSGLKQEKLEEETQMLITNNKYNALNQQAKLKISGFMADQIDLINQGQINKNNISKIEAKWKQQIDEWVGPTSGLTTSVIKILLTAMTR